MAPNSESSRTEIEVTIELGCLNRGKRGASPPATPRWPNGEIYFFGEEGPVAKAAEEWVAFFGEATRPAQVVDAVQAGNLERGGESKAVFGRGGKPAGRQEQHVAVHRRAHVHLIVAEKGDLVRSEPVLLQDEGDGGGVRLLRAVAAAGDVPGEVPPVRLEVLFGVGLLPGVPVGH